jgi:hypothetical protein
MMMCLTVSDSKFDFMLPAAESPNDEDLDDKMSIDLSILPPTSKAPRLVGLTSSNGWLALPPAEEEDTSHLSAMRLFAMADSDPPVPWRAQTMLEDNRSQTQTPPVIRQMPCIPASAESPRTPRTMPLTRSSTPPPLVQKTILSHPLLRALRMNSLDQVRGILDADSELASEPFWDFDLEPPICCAVRFGCSPAIVKLLLDHGASPEATDANGRTAAQLLEQERFEPQWTSFVPVECSYAGALSQNFPDTLDGDLGCVYSLKPHFQEVQKLLESRKRKM